ncbi:MAG: extracellular solute-binding protein [Bacilli bacterium]
MNKFVKAGFNSIIVIFLMLSLVACSNAEDKKRSKSDLEVFIPGYEDELWKGLYDAGIESFEKENDVKVNVIPAGWDEANSKIVLLMQTDEAPDVMITGSRSLRQFAEQDFIDDLSEYITDDFKEERVKNVLDTASIGGKQYGIPLAFSSRALYYRKDLIKNVPTTWDELLNTSKEISANNPDMYGFAIPTDITSGTDELFNFIYQNGGSATDKEGNIKLSTPENIATLEYLKKFNDAGIIPDPVDTSRSDQAQLFQNGDLAMFISGPWEKTVLDESVDTSPYGVALLPAGKQMAETLVTDSFSISSQSNNKELAWKFIEHMGQFEYQNAYDEAIGFFPILKEEELELRYQEEFLKPFNEMKEYGVPEPQVPVWDTFNEEFLEAVQKVMTGDSNAKDALKEAEEELNKK